jgi:Ca2+-binding RTX toxin-like protein
VFASEANLDGNADDVNEFVNDIDANTDIFLQDFRAGGIGLTRVSVDQGGDLLSVLDAAASSYSPAISNDGLTVAFATDGGGVPEDRNSLDPALAADPDTVGDIYIKDRASAGELTLVTVDPRTDFAAGGVPVNIGQGFDGALRSPSILDLSGDGQSIAFMTNARLDFDNDPNDQLDIYFVDLDSNPRTPTLVSKDSNGIAVGIGSLGDYVDLLVRPTVAISNDGRFVAFDTNARFDNDNDDEFDIFIWDRQSPNAEPRLLGRPQTAERSGDTTNPVFSMDGRFIAFESAARLTDDDNDVRDIYRVDRVNGNILRVSLDPPEDVDPGSESDACGPGPDSCSPSISGDGRFVAYVSSGAQVPGDANNQTDIYVRDLLTGRLTRANADDNGDPAEPSLRNEFSGSFAPAIAADGALVAFASDAPNLLTSSVFANGSDEAPALNTTSDFSLVRGDSVVLADVVFDNFRVRSGDAANNRLRGSPRDDLIEGLDGHDRIAARSGADQAFGGDGNDRLNGGRKSDLLEGNGGRDRLDGSFGDDRLKGGDDDDLLLGGDGNDLLQGGLGNDVLRGGRHNDRLEGNAGDDRLYGDRGADQFVFDRLAAPVPIPDSSTTASSIGRDRIFDFSHSDGDRIVLANFDLNGDGAVDTFADIAGRLTLSNRNTVIDLSDQFDDDPGTTDTITVIGVTPAELQSSDFVFE